MIVAHEGPNVVFLSGRMVRAQREYRCYYCGAQIAIGQVHYKAALTEDGVFASHRSCSDNGMGCSPREPGRHADALSHMEAEASGIAPKPLEMIGDYDGCYPDSAYSTMEEQDNGAFVAATIVLAAIVLVIGGVYWILG